MTEEASTGTELSKDINSESPQQPAPPQLSEPEDVAIFVYLSLTAFLISSSDILGTSRLALFID